MARHCIHSTAFKKQVVQEYAAGRPSAAWPPGPLHATLWWAGLGAHFFNFISGQLVRGNEISCSRVYVVPFSAASFACRRAFNLVVFSSAWTGAPFALTGCFVTAANSASARVRCFEVSEITALGALSGEAPTGCAERSQSRRSLRWDDNSWRGCPALGE